MARTRTNTISAADSFSSPITLRKGGVLTLTGTWVATVTVQRYDVGTSAWVDVTNNSGTVFSIAKASGSAPVTLTIAPFEYAANYRWGVKAGEFTSGSIVGTIQGS